VWSGGSCRGSSTCAAGIGAYSAWRSPAKSCYARSIPNGVSQRPNQNLRARGRRMQTTKAAGRTGLIRSRRFTFPPFAALRGTNRSPSRNPRIQSRSAGARRPQKGVARWVRVNPLGPGDQAARLLFEDISAGFLLFYGEQPGRGRQNLGFLTSSNRAHLRRVVSPKRGISVAR